MTCPAKYDYRYNQFQSTSPARGMTCINNLSYQFLAISIHIPREGDDKVSLMYMAKIWIFQSTSPARGMTGAGLLA